MSKKEVLIKSDGRYLNLYWRDCSRGNAIDEGETDPLPQAGTQLRWNPVLSEWIGTAAQRQTRTFFPPPDYCPLCVSRPGGFLTEIPRDQYDIAVFQNKFPAFTAASTETDGDELYQLRPAQGECEVIVYSSDHQATLTDLSVDEIRHLIEVWTDRYADLGARDYVKYVYIFENKGREIGVTLPHPHGQIYALPLVPPIPQQELTSAQQYHEQHGRCLFCDILARERVEGNRIIIENEFFLAFIPFYARWPYETHLYSRRHISALTDFTEAERDGLAEILKRLLVQFDRLWQRSFPYIMLLHQRPTDGADYHYYHFHIEFYPPYRTADKLKYLAGVEAGCGLFLNDTIAEEKAREIREAQEPEYQEDKAINNANAEQEEL